MYGEGLLGSQFLQRDCPLQVEHVSNASALMMAPGVQTTPGWEEHLRGLSESLGVMIGDGTVMDAGELFANIRHFTLENGLSIYRRPMRIRYSSSRRVAVVTPREAGLK